MNKKQLLLLLAVLAVIGGAGLVLLRQNRESWSASEAKMGSKVLPDFRYNDVAAIRIKGNTELNIVRKNGTWIVRERSDYPADFHQISDLLIKIRDLKVVQSETVGPSQLPHVDLGEPGKGEGSGTQVDFMDGNGKPIASLLLGKKHFPEQSRSTPMMLKASSPDGRYILLPENAKDVLLISDALSGFDPMPTIWLNKDFFKAEKLKSVAVSSTNAAGSWKISRETETAPWVLADAAPGEVLESNKLTQISGTLSFPRFSDILLNPPPAQTGLDKPIVTTIETFDHFTYTLKTGTTNAEGNYYVTVAAAADIPATRVAGKDESADDKKRLDKEFQDRKDKLKHEQSLAPWVYVIGSWLTEPLIRDRAQMLVDKKPAAAN